MLSRNPISDMEAIAAMPGLEVMADVLASHDPSTRVTKSHPISLAIFLASRWAWEADVSTDSVLRSTAVWQGIRDSAAHVGRTLPLDPPTQDQWRHYRKRALPGYADALANALTEPALTIGRSIGMYDPTSSVNWARPERENSIYGDGSTFRPLSDVRFIDGELVGSRAKHSPRVATTFVGKKGDRGKNTNLGLPIALVGGHGGRRYQRVVLGLRHYQDADEVGAALALFKHVVDMAGGGVHAAHYDMLMSGVHRRRIQRLGLVPIVEMNQPSSDTTRLPLPPELYRSRGKNPTTGKTRMKTAVKIHRIGVAVHETHRGTCGHDIHAIDGALVAVPSGRRLTLDAALLNRISVDQIQDEHGYAFLARYRMPCRDGAFEWEFDHNAERPGRRSGRTGEAPAAEYVSLIPEADPHFDLIKGRRSDVESTFATLKLRLDHARASKLCPEAFLADVVGGAMWINAIAWDVHAAQHTTLGRQMAALYAR